MGEHLVNPNNFKSLKKEFTDHLLSDVKAMECMLAADMFENDVIRIGAEQELCLIDSDYNPATNSIALLEAINDAHFTTELATYSIEINLDPFELKGDCFSKSEQQLKALIEKAQIEAEKLNTKILLTGILPTITKKELQFEYITPLARYLALNNALRDAKGGDFRLKIRGVDELSIHHKSILFEACNTSFQLHLQIPQNDFVSSYNWAQAISGPVLSVCCNSPLLFGRELWSETRIALFQQSLDTRKQSYALQNQMPRVGFGNDWINNSVADIFKEDIANHPILITKPITENSLELVSQGKIPKLAALQLHNGTVYRWNRPCYGRSNGKPHLRIENRYLPSGPTITDEMANFAFWIGLMKGRPAAYDAIAEKMDFRAVKSNFIKAARNGKQTVFEWDGELLSSQVLVSEKLLPIAYQGLKNCNVSGKDIDRLLGVIEKRTNGNSGSQWQIKSYRNIKEPRKIGNALKQLTKTIYEKQNTNQPVHQWQLLDKWQQRGESKPSTVRGIMSTNLFKLKEDDYVGLAKAIMQWHNIHHIPIENDEGKLTGLLTYSYINELELKKDVSNSRVADIMIKELIIIKPTSKIKEAINLMERHNIGCLPVCNNDLLVGIISAKDL